MAAKGSLRIIDNPDDLKETLKQECQQSTNSSRGAILLVAEDWCPACQDFKAGPWAKMIAAGNVNINLLQTSSKTYTQMCVASPGTTLPEVEFIPTLIYIRNGECVIDYKEPVGAHPFIL